MPNDTPIPIRPATGPVPGTGGGGSLAQLSCPARQTAAAALQGGHEPATSLYVHTPFCVHKCHYCDFYSFVDSRDQQGAYVDRLLEELRFLSPHAGVIKTIFVGGGTPSLLRLELWERVLAGLGAMFNLSRLGDGGPVVGADGLNDTPEFTVECNPESVTPELMAVLRAGGVTRVSMGAQSFVPRHLKTLERWHDPESVARALEAAAAAGIGRRSIDLIYAIPGQTLEEWAKDVETALALGTTHLSCYNLTYEPNTAMTVRLGRGEFTPVDEELEAEMFTLAGDLAAAHGLWRYEVSNYARPGEESTHNLAYWRQESWLAAGPSASGHVRTRVDSPRGPLAAGVRWKNAPNLGTYLESPGGPAPVVEIETPDPARAVRERLMTGLRLACGVEVVELRDAAELAAPGAGGRLAAKAAEFVGDGLLEEAEGRWRVTERGWLLADFVARKMMGAV